MEESFPPQIKGMELALDLYCREEMVYLLLLCSKDSSLVFCVTVKVVKESSKNGIRPHSVDGTVL